MTGCFDVAPCILDSGCLASAFWLLDMGWLGDWMLHLGLWMVVCWAFGCCVLDIGCWLGVWMLRFLALEA